MDALQAIIPAISANNSIIANRFVVLDSHAVGCAKTLRKYRKLDEREGVEVSCLTNQFFEARI